MKKLTQYIVNFKFTTVSGKLVEERVLIVATDHDQAKKIISDAYKKSNINVTFVGAASNGSIHVEDTSSESVTKHPFGLSDLDMISNEIERLLENTTKFKLTSPNKLDFYQGEESVLMELKNYVAKLETK